MKTEYYAGIPVDVVTYNCIIKELPKIFDSREQIYLTSINPQVVSFASKYPDILSYIEESDYRLPDGIGIVTFSKVLGGQIKERVTGIELMELFIKYASKQNKKIFLFGSRNNIVKQAKKNIKKEYNVKNCEYLDGYSCLSNDKIIQLINDSQPDFLFVGLGFPLQEKWIAKNKGKIKAQVILDVGGSFDVFSGEVKRAPQFYRDYHLEWLYRSLQRPKRLVRIIEIPIFVYLVLAKRKYRLKNGEIK